MAKNLFCVGGLYFEPNSTKGISATFGVSSKFPDRIQIMMITQGIVLAAKIAGNSEILLSDIDSVSGCSSDNFNDGKHLSIKLKDGKEHIINLKKDKKVVKAVGELQKLIQDFKRSQ